MADQRQDTSGGLNTAHPPAEREPVDRLHGRPSPVDAAPAPGAQWRPELASELGAPKPLRVPRLVGRLLAGEAAAVMMTDVRGASNAKAKRELHWEPRHPTWRDGLTVTA